MRTVDAHGVVQIQHPRSRMNRLTWWAAGIVVALAVAWLVVDLGRAARPTAEAEAGEETRSSADGRAVETRERGVRPERLPGLAGRVRARPTADDQPADMYLDQIGSNAPDRTGIHLFPRPGTKPIKGGILVPDGYELPPGYMRHYQTTDDGESVPAILVFHPDYQPRDAAGQPIPIPADRVVPPELAPPDMPVVVLEPPPIRRGFDENAAPR